ncbi:hypothetical protein TTHERM_00188920 (macronuclear) [Tetrahymena thermophila SB210]|uniref:Uncharacterized protein n=1 Tax=Tetrahymena thermophila (strain SB210) TaxID=312017 RepID=I7MEG7_TETTS|nr:hypothetical protein TTHERM_00188920 [Tetrahymena thermophila SB210]EAR96323.1 hypothetical protein TTHERM_00188920 [Tetrahymena thermophila SB210]|eukprot:XP_001016568.1 hypothetical protein TTHERM_00188920 [Tetrahymena thermophila SB210]
MFKIESLSEISQECRINSDKIVSVKKIDTENDIKVFQIHNINNALKQKGNEAIRVTSFKDNDKSDKGTQSFSNLIQSQIKNQKSLSPNAFRRNTKFGDGSPFNKRPSIKDKLQGIDSLASLVKINYKLKQDLESSNQVSHLKNSDKLQNDSDSQNQSSSSIESKTIPHSINIIKSKSSMVLIKQIQKGKTINFKQLQKLEDSDHKIEPLSPEKQKISDDLMQGETDIVKVSHQPLFEYVKKFNQRKLQIKQNQELTDETEQIKLLLLILKYIGTQDTIFSKIIQIIHKELSAYLIPAKKFNIKQIQNYAQELYSLIEEDRPKIQYTNYKQISQILLKCMEYYQNQNFMSYSNLIQQKQIVKNLNELHFKQLEAERAEKNKILKKDSEIEKLIKEKLLEQEKNFQKQIKQLNIENDQKIQAQRIDFLKKQQEISNQNQQLQEYQNLLKQKNASLEQQLTEIIEKIKQRRYNVLFQQIVQSSLKSYSADVGVQCDMLFDMRIKFPYKQKIKNNFNQLMNQ